MTPRSVLSPAAEADLEEIWAYSVDIWGEDQAARYLRQIAAMIDALASRRVKGRPVRVREGYWKAKAGRHFLYYRWRKDDLAIIRILHERMDEDAHLAP